MDYQVVLSDLFLRDLQEIVDYLKEHADAEVASGQAYWLMDWWLAVMEPSGIQELTSGREVRVVWSPTKTNSPASRKNKASRCEVETKR